MNIGREMKGKKRVENEETDINALVHEIIRFITERKEKK